MTSPTFAAMNYRFPLYCFFLTTVYMNVLWAINPEWMLNSGFQWGAVGIYLVLMIAAVRYRANRLQDSEALTLQGILKTAALVGVAGTIGFHLTQYLYASLQPETFQAAQIVNIEKVVGMVQSFTGDTDRAFDAQTLAEEGAFSYSFGTMLFGVAQGIVGDFLLAFIIALVMRR